MKLQESIRKILKEYLEEARLSDLLSNISGGDDELRNRIETERDADFSIDRELPKQTTLKKWYKKNKLKVYFKWNDTATHSIKQRIGDRSNFKNITEFINVFNDVFNKLLPDYIGYYINTNDRYGIYIQEYNITIIFQIRLNGVQYGNNKELYVYVITILPGNSVDKKTIKELFVI